MQTDLNEFLERKLDFYSEELRRSEIYAKKLADMYDSCESNDVSSSEVLLAYHRILDVHERIMSLMWDIISKISMVFTPEERIFLDMYNNLNLCNKRKVFNHMEGLYAAQEIIKGCGSGK